MYLQLYQMLADFAYGTGAVLTDWQHLCITLFATIAVYAVLVIPFVVVFWLIKLIVGIFQ